MTPMAPMTGAMRSSAGGTPWRRRRARPAARSMPVMAATRAVRFSASADLARHAGLAAHDRHASATPVASTTPADADVADRQRLDDLSADVGQAPSGHEQVGAAHEPAVAERRPRAGGS